MARRKKRRKRETSGGIVLGEVLAGRVVPPLSPLLQLIHRVNPTEHDLPAAEKSRRYADKTCLQSLLLRHYLGELIIVPEPGRPELVSIRHRYGAGDACHAVIGELDVDVRAAVQRQLDMQLAAEPGEAATPEPAVDRTKAAAEPDQDDPVKALVATAAAALDRYDYEQAQRLLRTALDRSGGAPEAAIPLLELLVEQQVMTRRSLPVPSLRWHDKRLAQLARAARDTLAGTTEPAAP